LQLKKSLEKLKLYAKSLLVLIEKHADRLILVPILVYTVFFSAYTCYMHYTFRTYAWDLGITDQGLWTTLNTDKILYSTLEVPYGNPSGNFLGVHFSPILLLILPIYYLFQAPETLLVFQSFILALAALPLYWIARDKLQNKLYGLAFAAAYLLNPALHGVNTFDFHVEIFSPLFILFAFYYIDKGKWLKAIPFLILELTTLEFAPLLVLSLGFYFFLKKLREGFSGQQSKLKTAKKLVPFIVLMLVAVYSFYLAMYSIEAVNPEKTGGAPGRWNYWGANVFEIPANIIRNPVEAITFLVTPIEKMYFLIFLFASVLLLPLFAPIELVMALPWLVAALLTDYPPYYQPYYQYSAFVIGQIFIAAIYGFQNLFSLKQEKKQNKTQHKMVAAVLMSSLLLSATISPVGVPSFTNRTLRPYSIGVVFTPDHVEKLHSVIDLVPANASVATIWDIFPHVCQRLHAYFLKWPLDYPVEYILVDLKSPTFTLGIYGLTPKRITIEHIMKDGEYGVLASVDGILLFQRGYNGSLAYYAPQKDVFNYKQLIPSSGKIIWDYTSASNKVITSDLNESVGVIWFGPYKYFVPGSYSATFRLKTANETCQLLLDAVSDEGRKTMALRNIFGSDFEQVGSWQDFSLRFEIDEITELEFRGFCESNNTELAVDYVRIEQLSGLS
jgi:uncharacterized membrane protein